MTETTVSEIARGTFLTQLGAINTHLDGCIVGKDHIHLHDLRVANRRTRAALIEFIDLFPGDLYSKYQKSFRWIQRISGDVRDLDVGLQHFSIYKKQISKAWRPFLNPLKDLLLEKRIIAQNQLVKDFQSEKMKEILNSWKQTLDGSIIDQTSLSLEPAKEFGSRRIVKRYQQVRLMGRDITKKTPAEELHAYRITVKKLRYLMEFFRPVLENEEFISLRTGLKTVQDAFGAFQDNVVQASRLRSLSGELHQSGVATDTLLALGLLLGSLEKINRKNKKACMKQVRWIIDDATARSFQSCFQYPVD
jgi:CHAD domain-containing protein